MKTNVLRFAVTMIAVWGMSCGLSAQTPASESSGEVSLLSYWYLYGYWPYGDKMFMETYVIDDSYEKNGKTYNQLLIDRAFYDGGGGEVTDIEGRPSFDGSGYEIYYIGIRESGGCIFLDYKEYMEFLAPSSYWSWEGDASYQPYRQTDDGEIVLYDFNMKEGDKYVTVEGHEDIIVVSARTVVTIDDVSRRMLTLSNGCILIEGIGCVNSAGAFLCYLNPADSPCATCLAPVGIKVPGTDDTVLPWEYEDVITGISETAAVQEGRTDIFDLQGRPTKNAPRHGIYLRNGKKYVK